MVTCVSARLPVTAVKLVPTLVFTLTGVPPEKLWSWSTIKPKSPLLGSAPLVLFHVADTMTNCQSQAPKGSCGLVWDPAAFDRLPSKAGMNTQLSKNALATGSNRQCAAVTITRFLMIEAEHWKSPTPGSVKNSLPAAL